MIKKKTLRLVKPPAEAFELKVSLLDTKPAIWRRFVISSGATLADLHEVLQIVMGWTNSHLHRFMTKDGRFFEAPNPYMDAVDFDNDSLPADQHALSSLKKELKQNIEYAYDFGDGWAHAIGLINTRPMEQDEQLPRCLDGKMACPPEDCGGVYGYERLLSIIKNPSHEEYEEITEWLGDDFDPVFFDLDETNELLGELAKARSSSD